MTAPSPVQLAGALVSWTITAGGKPLDSSFQVVSIDVWADVNKLPKARLVISDGDPAAQTFPISESEALIPGAALEISLGYDQDVALVFSGIVYRQGLEVTQNGSSRLVVEATDKAMAMTLARRNAVFERVTDSQLIQTLIGQSGLTAKVSATGTVQPVIVQYYCSDWDLMLTRAQLNGMVVSAAGGTVTVAAPDTAKAPVLTLAYGESILDFRAEMDASTPYTASAIKSFSWDPATQQVAASGQASADVTTPGNLSSDQLAKVFGIGRYTQQSAGTLQQADLTEWSSAELLKARLSKIRGSVRFQGSALVTPGAMVTLAGLGDRFNGNGYVSGLHHRVADGLWLTSVELGLSPLWFAATAPQLAAPGASGQLPPVSNLQTGLVLKTSGDPDGEFRVQVQLPLLQAGASGVWARLGSFYASNGIGAEFYPEVGDEVVVAFMNGDPRFPVIVGSLYSKKNPPPVTPDAKNNQKSIVTRSKLRIDFFEETKAVAITTPGGHSVRLDDDAKTITVKDLNGNSVTLAPGGITASSAADMTLTAKGNIAVTAQGNLSLKANANVSVSGLQIKADADTTFAAQGSAEAKLTSAAMVQIQGALVKIN
ncbi:type VI secretion system tip protein VgrG [Azospirillum thermophilum]|uniref:Rhs element Vgr protein n=1 Tax=Azospirillum thermophilum TaxID=2202148 RepID=A0A2S2CZG0_9PROT|nr:type VI secretion system tip protein VgrG [Azospirillum thermophilum]AWK89879.1 Rhs element Vgr protein [Azospirillum thermophilum]